MQRNTTTRIVARQVGSIIQRNVLISSAYAKSYGFRTFQKKGAVSDTAPELGLSIPGVFQSQQVVHGQQGTS
jgi:hypothetical protein